MNDRIVLIRLAASLPVGDEGRRAILASLKIAAPTRQGLQRRTQPGTGPSTQMAMNRRLKALGLPFEVFGKATGPLYKLFRTFSDASSHAYVVAKSPDSNREYILQCAEGLDRAEKTILEAAASLVKGRTMPSSLKTASITSNELKTLKIIKAMIDHGKKDFSGLNDHGDLTHLLNQKLVSYEQTQVSQNGSRWVDIENLEITPKGYEVLRSAP